MENTKMTFRKRILKTKLEVFGLLQTVELDNTSNKKAGYYSIKSIISVLNPIMDKYDVDLELNIKEFIVTATWYDCITENGRETILDCTKIKDIAKLPMMSNEVQSLGAIITYIRRYAYTLILGLNATDLIENAQNNSEQRYNHFLNNNASPNNNSKPNNNPTQNNNSKSNLIDDNQRKKLFAVSREAGKSKEDLNLFIKKVYNLDSITKLSKDQANLVIERLSKLKEGDKKSEG